MPDFFKRVRERRRLRARCRDREDLLLELGALVFELHRQGQRAPELLQAQAAALDAVDREVRILEGSLDAEATDVPADWGETGDWQAAEGDWPEGETQEWQAPEQGEETEQPEQPR